MPERRATARDVLNRLRWGPGGNELAEAEIVIIHRGAPNDERTVAGAEVLRLGRGSFETVGTSIPYHRVLRVTLRGETLYARNP